MITRSARHRFATLTSWTLAFLLVAALIIGFVAFTRAPTLQATGTRNVSPPATPIPALMPTPTPEPPLPDPSVWEERRLAAVAEAESKRAQRSESVQDVVDFAAADIESWSSEAIVSISVVLLDEPDLAFEDRVVGVLPNLAVPSASLAKAYWVAAAASATLDDDGTPDAQRFATVERRAEAIFTWSSNDASTALITTVGVDKINEFTDGLGMTETFLTQWASGQRSQQSNPYGSGNTTSTSDAIRFLDSLRETRRTEPTDPVAPALLQWMLQAPDDIAAGSYGGVLTDRLPSYVQPLVAHKAGWLPPACCKNEGNTLNAMGLIDIASFDNDVVVPATAVSYGLAISVTNGRSYEEHADFISWTSCLVFQTLVDASHGCGNVGDDPQDEPA